MTFCPQLETAPVTDVTVFFINPIGSLVAEWLGAGAGGVGASGGRAMIGSGLALASGSIGFNFAGRAIDACGVRSPSFGDETFVFAFGSDGAVCVADRGGAGRAAAGGGAAFDGASAPGGAALLVSKDAAFGSMAPSGVASFWVSGALNASLEGVDKASLTGDFSAARGGSEDGSEFGVAGCDFALASSCDGSPGSALAALSVLASLSERVASDWVDS